MKSWKVISPKKIELVTESSPEVGANQVKIKINKCAFTYNDTSVLSETSGIEYPRTIGTISSAMVTQVGENVTEFTRGDRVVTLPQKFCDSCTPCREGRYTDCANVEFFGRSVDGYMRDFAVVDPSSIVKLPDRIKDSEAVFLDAIALAIDTLSVLDIEKGEHIIITDAGVLGQVLAQIALYNQAIPIVIDIKEKYLARATENGIYYAVDAIKTDPLKRVLTITGGKMAECVALFSGNATILPLVLKLASHGGRVALVGTVGCDSDMHCNLSTVIESGLSIHGISTYRKNLAMAINMLANKVISVDGLASAPVSFDELGELLNQDECPLTIYQRIVVDV